MMLDEWAPFMGALADIMADDIYTQEVAELYRRFGAAVYRRALSLLGDEQEAMDVTQDTFFDFFKQKGQFRKEASPFTLLYQMATFQAIDKLRRRARWSGTLKISTDTTEEDLETQSISHDGNASQVEAAFDLALLTRGEKPDVLTAALLYFVEGYTTEEIGQTLDLSRKTVGIMLAGFSERAQKRMARLNAEGTS